MAGTLDLRQGFVVLDVVHGLTLDGGTVQMGGASLARFDGTQFLAGTGTLVFADNDPRATVAVAGAGAKLTIGPGVSIRGGAGHLDAGDDMFDNQGTIVASGPGTLTLSGVGWTNEGTMSANGSGRLSLTGAGWTNKGTISADTAGGSITLDGTDWSNTGSIQALTGSSVYLGPAGPGLGTFTNTGRITGAGGLIYLTSRLDNSGRTLALDDTTGPWYVAFGTILGGTVSTAGSAELIGTNDGGTLDGVTLTGTLDLASPSFTSAHITVTGGLALNQGLIMLAKSADVSFPGTQSLIGTGTANFNGVNAGHGLLVPGSSDSLTIAPGITLQGDSGFIGSAAGGVLSNQGTIRANGGGTLTVQGAANFSGGTLTGGNWEAVNNSSLRLLGADVVTSAAGILLDGTGSKVYSDSGTTDALAGFATNAVGASFTLSNGASLNTAGVFTNQGALTIGSGSTLAIAGRLTNDGSTVVDGLLAASGPVTVGSTGSLGGSGTVTADVVNGGVVAPGSSPGILAVTGNYTQTATGALDIEIGGTTPGSEYDRLSIAGSANLAGILNISLINGFGPTQGESFSIMTFGSRIGTFATINGLQSGALALFTANLGANDLILNAAATDADLSFDSVTIPASGTSGQNVSITYTVRNQTTAPAQGDWYDSIYLIAGSTFDPAAQLLGRVHHTGNVAGQGSYTETLTAPLPNLIDAGYHVVVVVNSRGLVSDSDRTNNIGISSNAFHVSVPLLTM